jgi:hypothetical protein
MEHTAHSLSVRHHSSPRPAVLALGALAGMLAAVALLLWAHFGNAVFYEMIVAGLNACF